MKHLSSILLITYALFSIHTMHTEPAYYAASNQCASNNSVAIVSGASLGILTGGLCSTITLGPVSCSVSALAAGACLLYSWWRSPQKQEASRNLLEIHDTQHSPLHDAHTYYQVYVLDDKAMAFLAYHQLNQRDYQLCSGTAIQHALHQECIDLVHDSAQLDFCENTVTYQAIVADAIDAGRSYAHSNVIDKAHTTLDWAKALLRYAQAVGSGIIDGAQQTIHSLTHPQQLIAQLSHDAHKLVCVTMGMFYECGLIETLIDIDNDALLNAYITDRSAYLSAMAQHITQYTQEVARPESVRTAVASTTHMILTGKCLHALGKFFSFAVRNASSMVTRIGDVAAADRYIATTIDGILVNAAHESAQLAFRAAEQQLPKTKVMRAIAAYEPPAVCIERLAKKYPQWATDGCKPLVHILKGHDVKGKLTGLHHDYGGYLEALGYVKITRQYSNGMYEANAFYNGVKFEKTFFPKDWTPEQVIVEVNKAIEQTTSWKIDRGRRVAWVNIHGEKVRIVLEVDGRIVSVFPDFDSRT